MKQFIKYLNSEINNETPVGYAAMLYAAMFVLFCFVMVVLGSVLVLGIFNHIAFLLLYPGSASVFIIYKYWKQK